MRGDSFLINNKNRDADTRRAVLYQQAVDYLIRRNSVPSDELWSFVWTFILCSINLVQNIVQQNTCRSKVNLQLYDSS